MGSEMCIRDSSNSSVGATCTVECYGDGGSASDSITIETREVDVLEAPTVTLERRVNNGSWRTSSVTINEGDRVSLRWESDDADSCYGDGPGFRTSDRTDGTDTSITEPNADRSSTYTVTCTNADGDEDSDSLTINTRDEDDDDDELEPPTVTLERRVNSGSWRTSSVTINEGDRVSLRWESDDADSCYGDGPGFRTCLLYTSPSPRDRTRSRMPSSA